MTIKIIDCTLRDGGYYNNWDFDQKTVQEYLRAMSLAGVDVVEIGFRKKAVNAFFGPFAYSTDNYLSTLNIHETLRLAVMVNASEFRSCSESGTDAIDVHFSSADSSHVSIVRIALRANEIYEAKHIALRLKELGYRLTVNLMQIDALSEADLVQAVSDIASWGVVDVLYFADSLGSLEPASVRKIVAILSSVWEGELGFHAHDNKGQALVNCMAAADAGVTWLDGTILGMGRGAGNVRTESMVVELMQREYDRYNVQALYPLVLGDFAKLHQQYHWGPSLFYHLAAVKGIHPAYVQELLASDRYSHDEILSAINYLSCTKARSYNSGMLGMAVRGSDVGGEGGWEATGWAHDKSVLIIGSGPSAARHMHAISDYICRYQPKVLCLNINRAVPTELVSAYVACHESRILIESHHYHDLGRPIILPVARVPEGMLPFLNGVEVFDYGLKLSDQQIEVGAKGCTLPSPLAVAYATAVAMAAGAKRILMAGFDGYSAGDPRQEEMIEVLKQYQRMDHAVPILAVTPTTYPITQRSIYEPGL